MVAVRHDFDQWSVYDLDLWHMIQFDMVNLCIFLFRVSSSIEWYIDQDTLLPFEKKNIFSYNLWYDHMTNLTKMKEPFKTNKRFEFSINFSIRKYIGWGGLDLLCRKYTNQRLGRNRPTPVARGLRELERESVNVHT